MLSGTSWSCIGDGSILGVVAANVPPGTICQIIFIASGQCSPFAHFPLNLVLSTCEQSLNLLDPLHPRQLSNTSINELLHLRLELGLMQMETVHGGNAQNTMPRIIQQTRYMRVPHVEQK